MALFNKSLILQSFDSIQGRVYNLDLTNKTQSTADKPLSHPHTEVTTQRCRFAFAPCSYFQMTKLSLPICYCNNAGQKDPDALRGRDKANVQSPLNKLFNPIIKHGSHKSGKQSRQDSDTYQVQKHRWFRGRRQIDTSKYTRKLEHGGYQDNLVRNRDLFTRC